MTATSVADLYVVLRGNSSSFVRSMHEAGSAADRTDSRISAVVGATRTLSLGLAAGALGVATVAVKMAATFNATMEKVHTQAGASQAEVDALKSKVLSLAGTTAQAPNDLANALYHVESVGYRGAAAMDVLTQAAKLSAISGANLNDVTYGLTSVMQTYGASASDAAKYAAMFNATVGAGDMRMQDFSQAIGTGYYSAAQSFGVSMQSASSALAFMTDRGQGAAQAATHLRMTLSLMAAPSAKAAKLLGDIGMKGPEIQAATSSMSAALKKAGLTTVTLSEDLKKPDGLFVALSDLKNHLMASGLSASAASALIARSFGGGRTDATILAMLNNLDILQNKYKLVGAGVSQYGEDWRATQKQFTFQVQQLKAQGEAWAIDLGQKLIPILSKVLGVVQQVIAWFGKHAAVTKELAQVIGTFLVGALTVAAGFLAEMAVEAAIAAAPFIALSMAIGFVARWLINLYQHNATFRAFVTGLATSVKEFAVKAMHWLEDAFHKAQHVVGAVIQDLIGWYHKHATQIKTAMDNAAKAVHAVAIALKAGFDAVVAVVRVAIRIIVDLWDRFGKHLLTHLITAWNAIMQTLRGVFEVIKGIFDIFAGIFTGNWGRVWNGIKEIFGGIWNIIVGILKTALNIVSTVIGAAVALISAVWGWLWHAVATMVSAGWRRVVDLTVSGVEQIAHFFVWLWDTVTGAVMNGVNAVNGWIAAGMNWFVNTVGRGIDGVINFFASLPGRIFAFVRDAGSWLVNAGIAVIEGFWNGLVSMWHRVSGWLSNIGGWIQNLKGPIDKDRQLLVGHGQAIMAGLNEGLTTGFGDVQSNLSGMAGKIANGFGTKLSTSVAVTPTMSGISPAQSLLSGASGGSATPVVNINVTVQGTVVAERDLARTIETQMAQLGLRRGVTYQPARR